MTMHFRAAFALVIALVGASSASAEVTEASENGFVISTSFETAATPEQAWIALVTPSAWWSGEHSYSGSAASFSVALTPGGSFCEIWDGGFVKHAEVIQLRDGSFLRLGGGLGPMQDLSAGQIQDWTVEPSGAGAKVSYTTRVSGAPQDGWLELAPAVDGVMALQLGRLERYLATGRPDE
jgi:uncharacterized protein YndB with AHSA1/START domain